MSVDNIDNFGYRESLDGLPEDLLKTLSIRKTREIDQELLSIIKSFSGIATLDEIIIRKFRQTNTVPDRQYINNRLLNLVKKKLLKKVPKTKAVYCLPGYGVESKEVPCGISPEQDFPHAIESDVKQNCAVGEKAE